MGWKQYKWLWTLGENVLENPLRFFAYASPGLILNQGQTSVAKMGPPGIPSPLCPDSQDINHVPNFKLVNRPIEFIGTALVQKWSHELQS